MFGPTSRKLAALWAIGQGLVTALVPGVSVAVAKRLLGESFENVDALEAKPAYVRQLRATGIGLAAAGVAAYAMERVAADGGGDGTTEEDGDETDVDAA